MAEGSNLSRDGALIELARRCGVAVECAGPAGERQAVQPATLRALLAGLGIAAQSDTDVARSLADLDEEAWRSVLAPVQVVRENEPFEVDVRLPEAAARLKWRLLLEDGTERSGEAALDDLAHAGAREVASRPLQCRRLRLGPLPMGYHRLEIEPERGAMSVIAAPERCWLPGGPAERYSGVSAQVYLLRSKRNWGIGDFEDLRALTAIVGSCGGDAVGVNPLHALFVDNPAHASPYGPSSRLLLNVLNVAVELVPEYSSSPRTRALIESAGFRSRIDQCRAADLVDFDAVAQAKLEALTLLFEEACERRDGERMQRFTEFRAARGATFERHCVYSALRRHMAALGRSARHWRDWPDSLGDSTSRHVADFARVHARDVEREAWLQFVADEQLATAARESDLAVGLYRDLAVGSDDSGAETWSEPDLVAPGVRVGAPPDALSESGQNWGLPPWNPRQLRASGYRSFADLLRANMRHAGALRIDHVMALERLFWIPEGRDARDGAYVSYPREDLFAVVALESHRARCMVIGEDLGTVPRGFRERMAAASMLSYRVLRFENEHGRPIPPARYPSLALAVAGNHDLATLKGWWEGADLALQLRHGIVSEQQSTDQQRAREQEKHALVEALRSENLLGAEFSFRELELAVHRYLGRTNAMLALAQIEDIAGQHDPVNVPNVPDYPSWRRRVGPTLEELDAGGAFASVVGALAQERRAATQVGNAR